jgi:hypothetical protein
MPRLSELLKNQVTLVVPYRGAEITISYKPESVTSQVRANISARIANGELEVDQYDAAFLAETLTSWDLTDDADQPYLITLEVLKARSNSLQMALASAVLEDQRNPQNGHTPASS